jgi:hypothetical protein
VFQVNLNPNGGKAEVGTIFSCQLSQYNRCKETLKTRIEVIESGDTLFFRCTIPNFFEAGVIIIRQPPYRVLSKLDSQPCPCLAFLIFQNCAPIHILKHGIRGLDGLASPIWRTDDGLTFNFLNGHQLYRKRAALPIG